MPFIFYLVLMHLILYQGFFIEVAQLLFYVALKKVVNVCVLNGDVCAHLFCKLFHWNWQSGENTFINVMLFCCTFFCSFVMRSLVEEDKHNHRARRIFIRKYAKKKRINAKQSKYGKGRWMFLSRFSASINMFTGNVAAPVFKCVPWYSTNGDFQHFLTLWVWFLGQTVQLFCVTNILMNFISWIWYFISTFGLLLFVLRCLMLVRILPTDILCDTVWIFHVSVYQERKWMASSVCKLRNKQFH